MHRRKNVVSNQDTHHPEPVGRLSFFHELDEWQKDNHYIRSGYVRETLSYTRCLDSLRYLHNETVNIYSHLIPSIVTALCLTAFYLIDEPITYLMDSTDFEITIYEKLNFTHFGVAAFICLFLSTLFHLFKSHSHPTCRFGNQCDYFGIVLMITSSLISIIVFAFNEDVKWRVRFITLFVLLGSMCTKVTFDKKFSTPLYRPFRSFMFILFGLSGILPVLAAVYLYGYEDAIRRSNAYWLVLEGTFYILGACLYAARFPERLTHIETEEPTSIKGKFDIFGHSHQIFHVFVVVAAYCHWRALIGSYVDMKARVSNFN